MLLPVFKGNDDRGLGGANDGIERLWSLRCAGAFPVLWTLKSYWPLAPDIEAPTAIGRKPDYGPTFTPRFALVTVNQRA